MTSPARLVTTSLLLLLLAAAPGAQRIAIKLIDAAAEAGIDLVNVSGGPAKDYIVDANGNGAAFFDYDNDDDLDVLIVNGSTRERVAQGGDPMVALYQNDGRGHFRDVTSASGFTRRGWGSGVCVGDYDNDGARDVYITAFGPDALWRNTGRGTFVDVTRSAGFDESRWGTGCSFADYDHDGYLDLYVANYVTFDERTIPARGTTANCRFMATDVFCGPKRLTGDLDVLYHNNGDGTFSDATARTGVKDPGYYGFGVVFTDLTDDGWPDIYVANDSVPNLLYRNRGNGTFVEEGVISGAALSSDGRSQAGMGVDAADYNGDGLPDLIVTNFSHDYNTLYENGPAGVFTDRSYATGVASTAGPYLGWGVKFVDIDNDGRLDIFVANGHVYPEVDKHGLGTRYLQRKQLFVNEGTRFRHASGEIGGGLAVEKSSRGAAFGDYDNDGDIDALVINMNDRPTLLRNDTAPGNHWITVRLVGTKSNRDGIGAKISVEAGARKQTAFVRGDGSYLSHSDTRAHFGLADATRVNRIEIRWPSGVVDTASGLTADRFYVAREGSGVTLSVRSP
ncbi:MAG TPA: CRTAC1 family protein [Vicinamibacterales bacterium]|jgi:enediyne biosynthesis protein E4|nr:CRTAC1 family protein [Vicinamibacterales bacterium]